MTSNYLTFKIDINFINKKQTFHWELHNLIYEHEQQEKKKRTMIPFVMNFQISFNLISNAPNRLSHIDKIVFQKDTRIQRSVCILHLIEIILKLKINLFQNNDACIKVLINDWRFYCFFFRSANQITPEPARRLCVFVLNNYF